MANTRIRAGIYCRLSLAVFGDATKVEDQERICRELCERLGWHVAGVYTDNSKSAWIRNRKRPDWDRMLADIEAGRLNAIATYHGDRMVRQPYDLETLLNLADGKGILLASPTGTRDLSVSEDKTMLRVIAAFACQESENTSRRKKSGYERMRRDGHVRPGGRRALGFERDNITHRPAEAAILRDAAAAILAGQSIGSVVAALREQGVKSVTGQPLKHSSLRRALAQPRMAGLMPGGVSQAAWQPIIEREQWEMLRAILAANPAAPHAGQGARHLLSGLIDCGECGHALYSGKNAAGPMYKCPRPGCGRVARSMVHLDTYVSAAVVARLSNLANEPPDIPADSGLAAEMEALQKRRAETEHVISNLADHPGQRIDLLANALASFDKRLRELRDRAAGSSRARLLRAHEGITLAEFKALPLATRRALVSAAVDVVVLRAPHRGGAGFNPDLVIVLPPKPQRDAHRGADDRP